VNGNELYVIPAEVKGLPSPLIIQILRTTGSSIMMEYFYKFIDKNPSCI
jgi:hypothetical protein